MGIYHILEESGRNRGESAFASLISTFRLKTSHGRGKQRCHATSCRPHGTEMEDRIIAGPLLLQMDDGPCPAPIMA